MRLRNQSQVWGSTGPVANCLISELMRSRKESVVRSSMAMPMIAKSRERSFVPARLYIAGMSFRFVKSPDAPKITITHGSPHRPLGGNDVLFSGSSFTIQPQRFAAFAERFRALPPTNSANKRILNTPQTRIRREFL